VGSRLEWGLDRTAFTRRICDNPAMKVSRGGKRPRGIRSPVLTLGNFDGVHLGHQRILKRLVERARALGRPSAVYTFDPHPLKVVAPHRSPPLIISREEKTRLIEGHGVDCLVFARFTRGFAAKHPREFVEDVLVKGLSVREVWVGHDFSFGKGRLGTVGYLRELGEELGFGVRVVPEYRLKGEAVSSSRIRRLVAEGDVGAATRLLGRPYSIKGKVVRGRAIGSSMGFPTANLRVSSELVPGAGVYAARAYIEGKRLPAVVNVGVAPTFGKGERRVEAHLMGFDRAIYGRAMEVAFVRRLRDERRFDSPEALARQIGKDVKRASGILSAMSAGLTRRKGAPGDEGDKRGL
jgi:riboflavin kinase/FMN adenylyltransferase